MIRRSLGGDLCTGVVRQNHPSPSSSGEPYCTQSQRIEYIDGDGNKIAQAHQYLQTNGSIGGADGRPDPKLILHEGTVYGVL